MANPQLKTNPTHLTQTLYVAFFLFSSTLSADSSLQQYASQPRWGQASLLSDNSLLIYGGKVSGTGGYTYSSSPNTDDIISLSLNSSFPTSSPPWQYVSGSKLSSKPAQSVSYASLGLLADPIGTNPGMILSFGGDASSLANLSSTDSSWIINLAPSDANDTASVSQSSWSSQPVRRMRHTLNSASSSDSLRLWVIGGQKSDGSETALNELWQYAAPKTSPLKGAWSQCSSAPLPAYDHASVAIIDSSNQVSIYALGGVGSDHQALSMSTLYRFVPNLGSDTCDGKWETVPTRTPLAPSPRRGHAIVSLSSTQILLYGGASANGQAVYDDVWLLDLSTLSWSQLSSGGSNSPGARWGHVMVRAGTKVVVGLGFGALGDSKPAPSSVGVYDLQRLQWAEHYSPTSSNDDHPSTLVSASSATANSPSSESHQWQVPGSKDHVQPISVPTTPEQPHRPTAPTSTIIGAILGLLGALAIGVATLAAHRYRKKANGEREIEAEAYRQKASGPDFHDGPGAEDAAGLMEQQDSLHGSRKIPRTQGGDHRFDHLAAGPLKALVGVGVGVRALWSHKSPDKLNQRFDMLADEESQVWVCADSASPDDDDEDLPSSKSFDRKKALQKYADGCMERVRLPPPPPCPMSEVKQNPPCWISTRGGLRIWNGLEEPAEPQSRFGTSTSFLGASLAPWSDDGRGTPSLSEYGMYDRLADPFSDRQSMHASGSMNSANQRGSWQASSRHDPFADIYREEPGHTRDGTGYSTIDPCDSPEENNVSSLNEMEIMTPMEPSTSSHSNLSYIATVGTPFLHSRLPSKTLQRQGTWWDRLRYGSDKQALDSAPGAIHPIRDPTPAPLIHPIVEAVDGNLSAKEPEGERMEYPTDEYGRRRKASRQLSEEEDPSQQTHTSHQTASTATSSMIEAATAQMVVVQRFRSTDSSLMSESSYTYHDRHPSSSGVYTPIATTFEESEPDSGLSHPLSPRPMGPRAHSPGFSLATTPLNCASSDPSALKRPPAVRTLTTGSVGVRAMVKQFETPPPSESPLDPTSSSRKLKVERSLIRKPLLFVANPDK